MYNEPSVPASREQKAQMNELALSFAAMHAEQIRQTLYFAITEILFGEERTYKVELSAGGALYGDLGIWGDEDRDRWIYKVIDCYNPAKKASFYTWLSRCFRQKVCDILRGKVRREANLEEGWIEDIPDQGPSPQDMPNMVPEVLIAFARLGEILADQTKVIEGVRNYQGQKPRYRAFYTRDFIQGVCEPRKYQWRHIKSVDPSISRGIAQAYVYYLCHPEAQNEADTLQLMQETRTAEIRALELLEMQVGGKLLRERYQYIESLNRYFGKANLTVQHDRYVKFVQLIFGREGIFDR